MSLQGLANFQASEIVAHAPDVLTVEDDFHVGLRVRPCRWQRSAQFDRRGNV
jgi:hypothetical protein